MEESIKEIMTRVTIGHVVGGIVALLALVGIVKLLFPKRVTLAEHLQRRRCGCGWAGEVSKFNLKCPKCARPFP